MHQLAELLTARGETLATVESCTGGLIAKRITDIAGSSSWFQGGLVTYANAMKIQLGVSGKDLEEFGAVSQTIAEQMAVNGRQYCQADWSVAVTGIAGPGGGSPKKPVGTVWMAWANAHSVVSEVQLFSGDRSEIRQAACAYVCRRLAEFLKN